MPQKKSRFSYQRLMSRSIGWVVNKIEFSKLAEKISGSQMGKELSERFSQLPEVWSKADKVSALAIDLTLSQLEAEGKKVDRQEIEELIKAIEIKYDRTLHMDTVTSLGILLNQVFDHQSHNLPFTSKDGRDLAHIETLRAYREQGLGVVYLINHSSHLDEFLVDLLWQYQSMGLPVFAAGQNMMSIKSIAKVLMTGSYVVLRQGASSFQMAALHNYCRAVSMAGEQQGIFLEAWRGGARTRDGSLRYPKRLVTLRGAIDMGQGPDTAQDLVIQPIALSFSAVPEDLPLCARKSPMSWLRGLGFFKTLFRIPFNPKTFLWKSAENLYGRAYISVPKPLLLSQLKQELKQDKTGIHLDEFVALSAIKAIAKSKKIMTSQITAMGLLEARKHKKIDIIESTLMQMDKAREYHLRTFGVPPDFEDFILDHSAKEMVDDGLAMLVRRGVISRWRKDKHGYPLVKNQAALSYYATHADRRLYSPTADQNIVVMGAGNWGFALASLIGNRILDDRKYSNASITIFDPREKRAKQMNRDRNGSGRFSEQLLPKNVFVTNDFSSAFRKASEVIIALKPQDFEDNFTQMLAVSQQPFKAVIATRGFVPEKHTIPYLAAIDLLKESQRTDVQLYILAGSVDPDELVDTGQIKGILAGPDTDDDLDEIMDLFDTSFVECVISRDPVGVQTADILARIYAIWVNYVQSSGLVATSNQVGYLVAQIADEASGLAVNLGGDQETFAAGSIPWTASFTSLYLGGMWREFGVKLGSGVKKGKDPKKMFLKIQDQSESKGKKFQALEDIKAVLYCADQYQVDMPVLKEIFNTLY